jgi:transposase
MARKFKTVDYERSGQQTLTIDDCLPADHLARFIVAIIEMLDLSAFYAYYAAVGGVPIDPKVLLGLLLYGYATGVFSSRKIEQAIYEIIPFRFMCLPKYC